MIQYTLKWIWCWWTTIFVSYLTNEIQRNSSEHEMKNENSSTITGETNGIQINIDQHNPQYKDVVIIGNGPSGIALSYILNGNFPYYNQRSHPDELLTARLKYIIPNETLLKQDLKYLAVGLEGRSRNPISLLVDALEHPNADLGVHYPSLLEWRQHHDQKIDHIVLGKGLPGGSWHFMDPHILTLSLGSWMALPGLAYTENNGKTRTSAASVAKYYLNYVNKQNLQQNFHTNTVVTEIKLIKKCKRTKLKAYVNNDPNILVLNSLNTNRKLIRSDERDGIENGCEHHLANVNNCKCCKDNKKPNKKCRLICCNCCYRCKHNKLLKSCSCCLLDDLDQQANDLTTTSLPEIKPQQQQQQQQQQLINKTHDVCSILDRSQSFTCDKRNYLNCTRFCYFNNNLTDNNLQNTYDFLSMKQFNNNQTTPQLMVCSNDSSSCCKCDYKWQIIGYNCDTGDWFTYFAKSVVLATGSSDRPNRLGIQGEDDNSEFILHNLRDLEDAFDRMTDQQKHDAHPVLVIGAGLSAADAIIVARNRSLPVIHVFRRKNASLDKQLPENMYPEYHKVHKMMSNTDKVYDLYTALPEHNLIAIDTKTHEVILENIKTHSKQIYKISFIAILIGARPDLTFLPDTFQLGVNKQLEIDCKTNPVHINPFTHQVLNYNDLYALGPLAGDNFVRFITGGALAIASDLFKKYIIEHKE